jgi:hypothetical protein
MGFERWANLAPEVHELQSFGYAEVSEDGSEFTVKLMNIDGTVMFSKVLTSETSVESEAEESDSSAALSSTASTILAAGAVAALL